MLQALRENRYDLRGSLSSRGNHEHDEQSAHLLGQATSAANKLDHYIWTARGTQWRNRLRGLAWCLAVAIAAISLIYFAAQSLRTMRIDGAETSRSLCTHRQPDVRREWRTLTDGQKQSYISAVHCLRSRPSMIHARSGVSRFDDFAWTHNNVGQIAHEAAAFLSWHRAFIAEFEHDLRHYCAYNGSLPYWDWSLDWQNPARSPVFDPDSGFGGNGDPSLPSPKTKGWCLTEGPFAGAMIPFHGRDWTPHCLSRKFANDTTFDGHPLRPYYLREVVLGHDDYFDMLMSMEKGPHNAIPHGVNGVFKSFLAPADPLFWLHHAQLDRVWWIWQRMQPQHELAYDGPSFHASPDEIASLSDILEFEGLREDIVVRHVITTTAEMLCYEYDNVKIGEL